MALAKAVTSAEIPSIRLPSRSNRSLAAQSADVTVDARVVLPLRPDHELAIRAIEVGISQLHATPRSIFLRRVCAGPIHPFDGREPGGFDPAQPRRRANSIPRRLPMIFRSQNAAE